MRGAGEVPFVEVSSHFFWGGGFGVCPMQEGTTNVPISFSFLSVLLLVVVVLVLVVVVVRKRWPSWLGSHELTK